MAQTTNHKPSLARIPRTLACAALFSIGVATSPADPIVSLGDPVAGAYYNSGSEVFPASNITDGRYGDTGTGFNWSFWLTPQGQLGSATINLQGLYKISSFDIQDTHNRGFFDRGTDAFDIRVSTDDVHWTTVLSSAFTPVQWRDLPIVNFSLPSTVVGQYVQFNVDTLYGGQSGGINELDVRGVPASSGVPDGGATAALLGLGLSGMGWLRRKV